VRCRCGHGSKCHLSLSQIFNLHPIFDFRCKVPLLLESFLLATDGKRGWIRALILVYTVLVQRVSATTRARIVKCLNEIVAIQKPVKATARGPVPACIPSQRVRFHAGCNHGVGFQRLLIKMSALSAAGPEAIAADRREMPRFSLLLLNQPTERPQPDVDNLPSGSPVPAEDHRLG
jgi:hypothetical protein